VRPEPQPTQYLVVVSVGRSHPARCELLSAQELHEWFGFRLRVTLDLAAAAYRRGARHRCGS
jgi:hypothetical protein